LECEAPIAPADRSRLPNHRIVAAANRAKLRFRGDRVIAAATGERVARAYGILVAGTDERVRSRNGIAVSRASRDRPNQNGRARQSAYQQPLPEIQRKWDHAPIITRPPRKRASDIRRYFVTDQGAGLVRFALIPHYDNENHPDASAANAEIWASKIPVPVYAIDDETAIKVSNGTVEIISEGRWKLLESRR